MIKNKLREIYEKSSIIFIVGLVVVSFIAGIKTEAYLAEKNFKYEKYTVVDDKNLTAICGTYEIEGTNPLDQDSSYKGKLILSLEKDILRANWQMDNTKTRHFGIGIVKNDILSISFKMDDPAEGKYTGIAQYKFITPEKLEGNWATFDNPHLGFEKLIKVE